MSYPNIQIEREGLEGQIASSQKLRRPARAFSPEGSMNAWGSGKRVVMVLIANAVP